jgi:hypothetical protein
MRPWVRQCQLALRAWALSRRQATGQVLANDDATPLAVTGAVLLRLLRLNLAPASTLIFRRWVIEKSPVAPRSHSANQAAACPIPGPREIHGRSTGGRCRA